MKIKSQGLFSKIEEFEFVPDPIKGKISLGVGSFGEVKLARNKKDQKLYAIKIMNLATLNSQTEIQGIEREINVQSGLSHPHIIKLYDSFIQNNNVNMILEFAKNGNLYSYLYKKRKFDEKEAFKFFYQTCLAIQYLHQNNIVHRDLKPENLLLDDNFNIKLCDFGWCTKQINDQRMTFCGTYEYMAPEIVFSKPYDYKIDIWALGILLYELVHGYAPFKGKTFAEIQKKIKKGDVEFSDKLSKDIKLLIAEILQSNPKKRVDLDHIFQNQWIKNMQNQNNQALLKCNSLNLNTLDQSNNENQFQKQQVNEVMLDNQITTFISCSGQIQSSKNKQAIKPQVNNNAEKENIGTSQIQQQQSKHILLDQKNNINQQQQQFSETYNYNQNIDQNKNKILKPQYKNMQQNDSKSQGQLTVYQQLLINKNQSQSQNQQQSEFQQQQQPTPKNLVYRGNQVQLFSQNQKYEVQFDDQQDSKQNMSQFTNFQSFNIQQQSQNGIHDYRVDPVTNLIKLDSTTISAISVDNNKKQDQKYSLDSTHNSFVGCNLSFFDDAFKQINSDSNNSRLPQNGNNNTENDSNKISKSQDKSFQQQQQNKSRNLDDKMSPLYSQNLKKTHRIFENVNQEQNQNLLILQDNINLCNQSNTSNYVIPVMTKIDLPKTCNRRVTTDFDLPAQNKNSDQLQQNTSKNQQQNMNIQTNQKIQNQSNVNNQTRQIRSKTLIFGEDNLDKTKTQIEEMGKLIYALEQNNSNNNNKEKKPQIIKNQSFQGQSQLNKVTQKENFPPKQLQYQQREKTNKIFDNKLQQNDKILKNFLII